jgi:transposase
MGRRFFTSKFQHEAVSLVRERGMAISQAAKDLGLNDNVLRR